MGDIVASGTITCVVGQVIGSSVVLGVSIFVQKGWEDRLFAKSDTLPGLNVSARTLDDLRGELGEAIVAQMRSAGIVARVTRTEIEPHA